MNVLAFDIETIPDVDGGRALHDLDGLADSDVAEAMFRLRREKKGSDFLPTHVQKVVAISAVYRNTASNTFKVWTLGEESSSEKELIQRFYEGVERFTPTLVTWMARALICRCCTIVGLSTALPQNATGTRVMMIGILSGITIFLGFMNGIPT
jgi:predicted PolB exonuclease-like 3'-5' exonuclease